MLVSVFQILHDPILADHLLNLSLCFSVERIFVEQLHLLHPLALTVLFLVHLGVVHVSPPRSVIDCGGHCGVALLDLAQLSCVS